METSSRSKCRAGQVFKARDRIGAAAAAVLPCRQGQVHGHGVRNTPIAQPVFAGSSYKQVVAVAGIDRATLASRAILSAKARAQNPGRWSGQTRNWQPAGPVWLNPEDESSAPEIRDAA